MHRPSRAPLALIGGGAGFIGSALCDRFLGEGWRVLCLDNFETGREENVAHLRANPDFELRRVDVARGVACGKADLVLNFACPASPPHYQRDPIGTMRTNVLGTLNMLELAQRAGARFVQASTSEVYGDPVVHPQTEAYWGNVNPTGIRACYDEGKRAAETLCFDFRRCRGLDVRVVRIFNTYGPRMAFDDGRVVSNFIVQALTEEPLTVYGDGRQTRSFCFVDDLVEGICRVASLEAESVPGPINLGSDLELSVRELADLILHLTDSRSRVTQRPLPQDDPRQRRPDLTRARTLLNWGPRVTPAEGLQRTVADFRVRLARGAAVEMKWPDDAPEAQRRHP